jgi:Tol biopolymer transport system component
MSLDKRDLQRTFERFEQPEPAFDRLVRRRERRDRRKRIEAGITALVIMLVAVALVSRSFDTMKPADQTPTSVPQAPKPGIWIVDPVSDSVSFVWGPDWLDRTYHAYGSWIGAPTMSPNGDRIAFAGRRDGSPFGLWTVSATGQDLRQITDCSSDSFCPLGAGPGVWQSWSPDGRSIALSGGPNSKENPSDIYAVNADGTDMRKLVAMPGEEDIADWSPDGTQIVFDHTSSDDPTPQIYVAPVSGGAPTLLVDNGSTPSWSPDGRWIAFSRDKGLVGATSIWVVHADGSDAHRVADGEWAVGWSPDGSHLAVFRSETTSLDGTRDRRYAIVDIGTGEVQTLDVDALDTAELLFQWPAGN